MKGLSYRGIRGVIVFLVICPGLFSVARFYTGAANASIQDGLDLRRSGRYSEAVKIFESHWNFAQSSGNKASSLECGLNLGFLYWNLGNLDQSRAYFREARYLAHILGLKLEMERCRTSLRIYDLYQEGKKLRQTHKPHLSIKTFEAAIDLSRSIQSREHELKCMRQMSLAYLDQNRLEEYFQLNKKGLELSRELNHKIEEGRALNNIGHYFWQIKEYSEALGYFMQALALTEKRENIRDQAAVLNNIGLVYKDFGQIDRALFYQMKSMDLNRDYGTELDQAVGLNNISNTYYRRSEINEDRKDLYFAYYYGLECLDSARKLGNGGIEMIILNNLAGILRKLGRNGNALELLTEGEEKARASQRQDDLAVILSNKGSLLLETGHQQAAEECLCEAQDLSRNTQNSRVVWETLFSRGLLSEKQARFKEALDFYRQAAGVIHAVRRGIFLDVYQAGFIQTETGVFDHLISLLFRLWEKGRVPDEAVFSAVEQAKARGFLDIMTLAGNGLLSMPGDRVAAREHQTARQISRLMLSLCDPDLSTGKRDRLLDDLRAQEEKYEILLSGSGLGKEPGRAFCGKPCGLEDFRRFLPDDRTVVAEYYCGKNTSYLLFFTKADFFVEELPGRELLVDDLRGYLKSLQMRDDLFIGSSAAHRLGRELLSPLADSLKDVEYLLVIPDGILYSVPFETLMLENEDSMLFQRLKVSYAPSASSLIPLSLQQGDRKGRKKALIFGSPNLDGEIQPVNESRRILKDIYLTQGFDFSPLPAVSLEIRNVNEALPDMEKDVFIEEEATEGAFKSLDLFKYGILHFACHSFMDSQWPMRSALLLGLDSSRQEDGFLQAREIPQLELEADLVVLSGCQTGSGPHETSEGMLGLPRAFFYAGAKAVLSSLWHVSDKSSAEFMRYFYNHLHTGAGAPDSLQRAKMDMKNSRYAHPFYWAGYVLYGDPLWKTAGLQSSR